MILFHPLCSYHRKRLLDSVHCMDMAVRILDEVRVKYRFSLVASQVDLPPDAT